MAVIDFSLIRLAAASLFTPVSVSSYHITLQSADFICTGIRQRSKKVWPHNNRLWEPGISSPHTRTSCCLSNCKNLTDPGIQLWMNRAFPQTATWNCCYPNNPLLVLVFFSALTLWCWNLLRCWKETHSHLAFWLVEKKKRGEMSLQIGREKSSLCLNTEILFTSAQLFTCECLHSHFLLPAVQRDALSAPSPHECTRKERQIFKFLPHSQTDFGGNAHKAAEKRAWRELN